MLEEDEESYTGGELGPPPAHQAAPALLLDGGAAAGVALTMAGWRACCWAARAELARRRSDQRRRIPSPTRGAGGGRASGPLGAGAGGQAPAGEPSPPDAEPDRPRREEAENVSVKIESDPPGAEVAGEDGNHLGITPTTLASAVVTSRWCW